MDTVFGVLFAHQTTIQALLYKVAIRFRLDQMYASVLPLTNTLLAT